MSKTLILSDIHFSKPSSSALSAKMFTPLFTDVDALILNGDTAETLSKKMSAPSIALTEDLISLASKSGIKVELITGNHDPDISKTHHVFKFEKRVLVMHGHAVLDGVAPWSWRCKHIKELMSNQPSPKSIDEVLEQISEVSRQVGTDAMESNKPSIIKMTLLGIPAVFHIIKTWFNYPTITYKFLQQYAPKTNVCITGHTHRQGVWIRNDVVIINTGCFAKYALPSSPLAVVLDSIQRTVTVHSIKTTHEGFELAKSLCEFTI